MKRVYSFINTIFGQFVSFAQSRIFPHWIFFYWDVKKKNHLTEAEYTAMLQESLSSDDDDEVVLLILVVNALSDSDTIINSDSELDHVASTSRQLTSNWSHTLDLVPHLFTDMCIFLKSSLNHLCESENDFFRIFVDDDLRKLLNKQIILLSIFRRKIWIQVALQEIFLDLLAFLQFPRKKSGWF